LVPKINKAEIENDTKTEIQTVFFTGSKTPTKLRTDQQQDSTSYPNKYQEKGNSKVPVDIEPDHLFVVDKIKQESKESDCAVGSCTENPFAEFDPETLYWTPIPEHNLNNTVNQDNELLPVKTEAQEAEVSPFSGCLLDCPTKPDPDMADPFYEEYMDLSNLFPELFPGFDPNPCDFLVSETEKMTDVKEEVPALSPSDDILKEIDSLLVEAELSNIKDEELIDVEVIEEASSDQGQADYLSSCASSPGSINTIADSTSTEVASPGSVDMHEDLQQLLDFLEKADVQDLETIELEDLLQQTASPQPTKRKLETSDSSPAAKRHKPSMLPGGGPEDKLTARRIKNNAASRVCRASRKQKEKDLFAQEDQLVKANAELRAQVEELTKETETLRKILVQRLSGNLG